MAKATKEEVVRVALTPEAGQLDDGFFGGDATGYDDGYAGEALL